jgi:glycosyltransferase involved in cell wall biosynthesis
MRNPSYRILHIDTERTWRGGQQQAFSLMRGLERRGHHNILIARKNSPLLKKAQEENIQTWAVNPWSEAAVGTAFRLSSRLLEQKIDVVHAHSAHAVMLARLITYGTPIPYVLTRRVDFQLQKNLISRWKYRGAAKILAISNAVEHALVRSGIPHEKIERVPSGVDFTRYDDVRAINRSQWGISAEALVVGQVAALAPHKDQETFITALARAVTIEPRLVGVIAGDGPLRKELEQQALELNLGEHIKFLGFVERPLDVMKGFDVFCMSSKEEGLGTSIIDAMALDIPVVATAAGGIPELIEDLKTGYLAPVQNAEVLAQKIIFALRDHAGRAGIISRAREKAYEFDVQSTILKTELAYRSILQHKLF